MRLVSPRDRGSATAEWALVLPAVVLVVAAILTSVAAVVEQSRLDHAAADAARLASLGQSPAVISRHVLDMLGTASRTHIERASPSVCVTLTLDSTQGSFVMEPLRLEGRACALDPGVE